MNFADGFKEKGMPTIIIPDCSRDNLPVFFIQMGYNKGAEIGVYKGEFSKEFCEAGISELHHYAVDPWIAFYGQGKTQKVQERQNFLYEHTKRVLAPYKNCTIIRKTSVEALKDFKDGSLDYVYIDGDHSFPFVAEDIYGWAKKVRSGGIVSGHDYFDTVPQANNVLCHVRVIVDAYVKLYDIKNLYLFGKLDNAQKQGDTQMSWMFLKP